MAISVQEAGATHAPCGIAVMAKASIPGRTKTRLVPPLSDDEAAAFNTAFCKDIAANLLAAGHDAGIAGYFAHGPRGSAPFFRENLPAEIGLIEMALPTLGECLIATMRALFARGHDSVIVLNSDSPTLPTSVLVEAAAILAAGGDRMVFGPASDGGYYLLGLNAEHHRLFEDIDWSTDRVARQTLERAAELDLPVHTLPIWYDIDDAQALRMLHAELAGHDSFDPSLQPYHAAYTATLLATLAEQSKLEPRLRLRREVA